jgi:hypothetical protein
MEIFQISCAVWYCIDIENFQFLGRLVLKRYRNFSKSLWREVVKRYQNYQSPVASGVRGTLYSRFSNTKLPNRNQHNVIELKQNKYKLKCFDFLSRFLLHGVRSLILTAFVIPISNFQSHAVLVSGTKAEVLRRVVVVGKRPHVFSAYGMSRAIHPLPPYNTYFYIPFTLQRVCYTCLMRQFRVCIPWIHKGPKISLSKSGASN